MAVVSLQFSAETLPTEETALRSHTPILCPREFSQRGSQALFCRAVGGLGWVPWQSLWRTGLPLSGSLPAETAGGQHLHTHLGRRCVKREISQSNCICSKVPVTLPPERMEFDYSVNFHEQLHFSVETTNDKRVCLPQSCWGSMQTAKTK